ncbi:MAG: hypothetical protein ACYS99_00610 [Planctomycetota bacterium]|jgi:hypothetical protein
MGEKAEQRAIVFAASRVAGRRRGTVALGFRPPRTTLLAQLTLGFDESLFSVVEDLGCDDPTVLVESGPASFGTVRAVARARPGAEVLSYEAAPILKFLWFFRDKEDPLFLGHAGERDVLDETYAGREPPRLTGVKGEELRRSIEEVRELVLTMGRAIGVKPPIPELSPAPGGWGARRVAATLRASCGLYAGLLHRWGAPIARTIEGPDGPPRLELADAWLAGRR